MRHTQNHRANLPFKCGFLFIHCSAIPFFPPRRSYRDYSIWMKDTQRESKDGVCALFYNLGG